MDIEFYIHHIGAAEKRLVSECLDGIFLTTGSYVKTFETEFARYLNLSHSVGLTSCTAGLHLSLEALGIGPGDEVITTPMTFIASATSIIHTGAVPVFADVDPETGLIDPEEIQKVITRKTRAILPVHLYGQMCDMKKIRALADAHHLKVIEDAAHCIEGKRDGYGPGQLGDVACFSFYATKNITSGEGGAIATNNPELADKIRLLRQHGMSREAADRYSGTYQHWDMPVCGWKYNMSNIQGALLIPQLSRISQLLERRRYLFRRYVSRLQDVPGVHLPGEIENSENACHLFTIWVDPERRDEILTEFGKAGIGVAVNYRAIHLLKYFRETFNTKRGDFPVAERIGDSTISLPFYPSMPDEHVDRVVDTLKQIL